MHLEATSTPGPQQHFPQLASLLLSDIRLQIADCVAVVSLPYIDHLDALARRCDGLVHQLRTQTGSPNMILHARYNETG